MIIASPRREPCEKLVVSSCQCWASAPKPALQPCDASSASKPSPGQRLFGEPISSAGFYRTVGYLPNGLQLPLEANAQRFSRFGQSG